MKPRVTAQRKFAQGAFIPSAAALLAPTAAASANSAERRDAPSTSDDNIVFNRLPVDAMLDVVCFQNSHNHLQPIVLVERLTSNGNVMSSQTTSSTRGLEVPETNRMHVMTLRSRKPTRKYTARVFTARKTTSRHKPTRDKSIEPKSTKPKPRPEPEPTASVQNTITYVRKSSTAKKSTAKYNNKIITSTHRNKTTGTSKSSGRGINKANKKRVTGFSVPLQLKRRRMHSRYSVASSDFSADDNRPLTYFVRSTPNRKQPIMGPPRSVPRSRRLPERSGPSLTIHDDASDDTVTLSNLIRQQDTNKQDAKALGGDINVVPRLRSSETPLDNGSSTSGMCNGNGQINYYSEQGIYRWIDGSLSLKGQPSIDESDTVLVDEDEVKEECDIYECPSLAWRTVNDVVTLSKADYETMCKSCISCFRIKKFEKICLLLKNAINMQDNMEQVTDTQPLDWNPIRIERELHTNRTVANNNIMYVEMLPRHPHLMIKIIHVFNTLNNSVNACVVPRSKAEVSIDFSFVDHEFLADKLLEVMPSQIPVPDCPKIESKQSIREEALVDPGDVEVIPVAGPSGTCKLNSMMNAELAFDDDDTDANNEGKILKVPTFYPTPEELTDPMAYFEKIKQEVSEYGICKIVPATGFAPKCKIDDSVKFEISKQYISRLYNRWGSLVRELCAIRTCLGAQHLYGMRPPVIDGIEVNLPKLYHLVQRYGGLENVINKNKWGKVADDMNLNKGPSTEKKLDQIYVTYLLPYDTLTPSERQEIFVKVEKSWNKRNNKMLEHANNPLHRQKYLLGESESSSEESDNDATKDAEDCVVPGQIMNLGKFKRVAKNAQHQFFRHKSTPLTQIEDEYWRIVMLGTEHICVNTASIDTGEQGLGFSTNRNDSFSDHAWNLKVLTQNKSNILRSLGPTLGVTVPTIHVGMIFSTSCWHRDPHAVPWIEFSHMGPAKIWYSVPEKEDAKFRAAAKALSPTSCQNKDLWLSSDISMIPPNLLCQHNVKVYRVEQNPGEFVLVMPRAYSCSISTGYTVSESVYFATETLLEGLINAFEEIRTSCEPTMFALEHLLKGIVEDKQTPPSVLKKVQPVLGYIYQQEIERRKMLETKLVCVVNPGTGEGLSTSRGNISQNSTSGPSVWNVRDQDECEMCRCTLYLSKVKNIHQNTYLCLEHTLKLLNKKRNQTVSSQDFQANYIIPTSELSNTLRELRESLERLNGDEQVASSDPCSSFQVQ